jgi:hypothetical protein
MTTRVADEVRDARGEVFRAYVRAREKARELAGDGRHDAPAGDDVGPPADAGRH